MDLHHYLEHILESLENIRLLLEPYIKPMKHNSPCASQFLNWRWINFQAVMVHLPLNMTFPSFSCFCIKLDLNENILFYTNFK